MKHKLLALCPLLSAFYLSAHAQGTAFTYQGRLNSAGTSANGSYDLAFALFDAASVGVQQGLMLTNTATAVSNGLFTVTLDFGNQFAGANRWLEIAVCTNGSGAFAPLAPRQPLTATPYAVTAGNLTGSITAAQLPGTALVNVGASGSRAVSIGFSTTASGFNSTALGNASTASGNVATALGGSSQASGSFSTAMGYHTRASGSFSTAMGRNTTAANDDATAMGLGSIASGWDSTAMGTYTVASGHYSIAAGFYAQATNQGAFVWADSTSITPFASTADNQFLIRATGGVGIGTANPQGSLHVYSVNNPTVARIQSSGTPGFGRLEFVSNPQGESTNGGPATSSPPTTAASPAA